MKKILTSLVVIIVFTTLFTSSRENIKQIKSSNPKQSYKVVGVGFYNVENLFDTINQENRDEEYLPDGAMRWTGTKYRAKLKNISYAISQIGKETLPNGISVLGISEVENRGVLEDLVKQTSIADKTYKIVHYDSPDKRGIDVGLIYNPRDFIPTSSKSCHIALPDTTHPTRDVLVVSGYLFNEKFHFLVNHWPSRYGGEEYSAPNRAIAAKVNREIVDSLYSLNDQAKIVIMGDLNDDPFNTSVSKILNAKKRRKDVKKDGLYNPFWKILDSGVGSLAYKGAWNLFDQIIVSAPLLDNRDKTKLTFWKAEVFNKDFLIQQEGSYRGNPLRTHAAGVWLNGYSDHLPTLIYLVKEKK